MKLLQVAKGDGPPRLGLHEGDRVRVLEQVVLCASAF